MNKQVMWLGYNMEIEEEGQWIQGITEPDPDWSYLDKEGHGHFYRKDGDHYPTLVWAVQPCTMGHGDDCDGEGRYLCAICSEVIAPRVRSGRPTFVPTGRTITLTDAETTWRFGSAEFNMLRAAIKETIYTTLSDHVVERRFRRGS